MTEQTPETPAADESNGPDAGKAPTPAGDDGKGGKSAILADLASERDKRQALEKQMTDLRNAQQRQTEALAKAFGLKDGEKPEADQLAQQVGQIQARLDAAERKSTLLEVASEHGIPKEYQHLLTASDGETLKSQAAALAELVKGRQPGSPTPDPSQGAQPISPQAQDDAEYQKFYPNPTR